MTNFKPILILVVHDLSGGGGMEQVLRGQLPSISSAWDLRVVSCTMDPILAVSTQWHRVRVPSRPAWLKILLFWLVSPLYVARIRKAVSGQDVTVWSIGAIARMDMDAISVHFCHAAAPRAGLARQGIARQLSGLVTRTVALRLERRSFNPKRVAALFSVSKGLASELAVHYPDTRIVDTPNGVDPVRTDRSRVSRGSAEDVRALFVGGDWARKGLALCIQAVANTPGVRLHVVGNGPPHLGLDVARNHGVLDRVSFEAWTPDVAKRFDDADVLLLPSRYETFGMVLFEAASHGLVPVATRVYGAVDLIEDGVSGFFVNQGSASDIAAVLTRLSHDRAMITLIGDEAREKAAMFTRERSIQLLVAALRSISRS